MTLRINTNTAALNAHKNMVKTDNSLTASLEKLSSGLRINKAADDASGMAIADSLRSQALGLGQAIRNGNDGISIVQTADAALEESINIVNTIKMKAIQSAQDGQTTESRKAIQADISKLREELDTIAKTTAFNNQKLLSGNFTDKQFQIGAYAGETVDISIQSTEATKIGHITTSEVTFSGEGTASLSMYSNLKDEYFELNDVYLRYNNSKENSLAAVAAAMNKLSDTLGISATAVVESTTTFAIAEGTTDETFAINGIAIGKLAVKNSDSNGALVTAINTKTSQHGVTASTDETGRLTLTSTDGRAISVSGDSATGNVLGRTTVDEMSTFGRIEVRQEGTSEIIIMDKNDGGGAAVSTIDGGIYVSSSTQTTTKTIAADGSILGSTTLGSGSIVAGKFTVSGTFTADDKDMLGAGSTISAGSTLASGVTIEGDMQVSSTAVTAAEGSLVKAGSVLACNSILAGRTIFYGDVSSQLSGGVVYVSGTGMSQVTLASGNARVKNGGLLVAGDSILGAGSDLGQTTLLKAGSTIEGIIEVQADADIEADMELNAGSTVTSGTVMATGSTINDNVQGFGRVEGEMTLATGTSFGLNTLLADGSTISSSVTLGANMTVAADGDMSAGAGSTLASGSILTAGSYIGSPITDTDGRVYDTGTVLETDITIASSVLSGETILAAGSRLLSGSILATNNNEIADFSSSDVSLGVAYRLSDVDVTTQEGAQIGIAVSDAALKTLDKVRSDLGSVQNQLTSTIANITTTKVNVLAAESTIRDVDFAEESSNFTKMQILSQAGTFAMAQANTSAEQVLSLLQ